MIGGTVRPGWEAVREAFAANFAEGDEVGAAVSVFADGEEVVALHGGTFDEQSDQPYGDDTLQLVFSTTKGVVAIAVAMCAERGLIRYEQPVVELWPEFAAHGKANVTVAQLLSHQAGLAAPDGEVTLGDALDWDAMVAKLAASAPAWPLGQGHGYHAVTFGWLAGELIRRCDGRGVGRFIHEEIAQPLGVDLWIGLPPALEQRVSPIIGTPLSTDHADPTVKAMLEMFLGPHTLGGRALSLNGAFAEPGAFNRPDVHAAEIPAANAITNARSLAKMYAATLGEVRGATSRVRLLQAATVDVARRTVTPANEPDKCLLVPTAFGMGFMTSTAFSPLAGAGSFGHPGAGGSVAFAQPERGLAFAYTMNAMAKNLANDPRAQRLIDAAVTVVDSQRAA